MVTVSLGNKKKQFRSIKEACQATGQDYMRVYMRIRMGMKPAKALTKPARAYRKAA